MTDEDSDAVWASVFDINLSGPYCTIRRCFPDMMRAGWGRIIDIASTAANARTPTQQRLQARSAGTDGLIWYVALEGAAHGSACNAINPGSVGTGVMKLGSEVRANLGQGAPGRRTSN